MGIVVTGKFDDPTPAPSIRTQRAESVSAASEEPGALIPFLRAEVGRTEVVCPGERADPCRQRRCVVDVAALGEHAQQRPGQAVPRAPKPGRVLPSETDQPFLGARQLVDDSLARVFVKPRFVVKAVIPDLVPSLRDRSDGRSVLIDFGVLPHDEHCGRDTKAVEQLKESRNHSGQIGRECFP